MRESRERQSAAQCETIPHSLTHTSASACASACPAFTPSATPLLVLSPEFSVWSFTDSLADESLATKHWAGEDMSITGALSVDGSVYRFLGNSSAFHSQMTQISKMVSEGESENECMRASDCTVLIFISSFSSAQVLPTTTYYLLQSPEGVQLNVLFTSVVDNLVDEAEASRPYGYVTLSVNNTDSKTHAIAAYFDVLCDFVLDQAYVQHMDGGHDDTQNIGWRDLTPDAPEAWIAHNIRNYDDSLFSLKGDYFKTNWGSVTTATKPDSRVSHTIADAEKTRAAFAAGQALPAVDTDAVRGFNERPVASAYVWNFGPVAPSACTGASLLVSYDDEVSINYFGEHQVPLWRHRYSNDLGAMIIDGLTQYPQLLQRCINFDKQLFIQLTSAGGNEYALITSLAYRQVTGGIKAVWSSMKNESRWYMKEISSDGDISTVDVIYPAAPFFIQFAPNLLQKMLLPLFDYALNETDIHYNLPWAPVSRRAGEKRLRAAVERVVAHSPVCPLCSAPPRLLARVRHDCRSAGADADGGERQLLPHAGRCCHAAEGRRRVAEAVLGPTADVGQLLAVLTARPG